MPDGKYDYINFEYTPLTVGRAYLTKHRGCPYGGGFIEPFAYRGAAPTSPPSDGSISSQVVSRPFALVEATGTSSSAFAGIASDHDVTALDPQVCYWSVKQNDPNEGDTLFGDGGLLENYGIIPLIQRGVQNIVVFINTNWKLDPNYKPNSSDPHALSNDPTKSCDASLVALFGYSNPKWDWTYPTNQIFPPADLLTVLDKLKARKSKGEPMIVNCQHTTVANDIWGVKSGQHVSVTWCYLDRCAQWETQLGSETIRDAIDEGNQKSPKGDFELFPNYATVGEDGLTLTQLTAKQVALLADFACDVILLDSEKTVQNTIES